MKIRRLDVVGFKSFKDKTILMLDQQLNGVVGPNGCGKSNIVDAIRWCMGEQSAKNLRGKAMEDVIFAGSDLYPPQPYAEVKLTLITDGANLPQQYRGMEEMTVSRRLYRNGDSGYFINGSPVRLLDVTELFLGTGVGTKAYSVIEQGRIGAIVSARPADRRAYIEEAAGISLYRNRRRIAERKLERTTQNLLRLGDIIEEVKRNLNSLHKQAKKAERFKHFKDELKELELRRALIEFRALKEEIESLRAKTLQERTTLEALTAETQSEETLIETERLELIDEEGALNEQYSIMQKLNEELSGVERQLAVLAEREDSLLRQAEENGEEASKTEEIKVELGKRLVVEKNKLEGISEDEQDRDNILRLETAIARAKDELENLNSQLEAVRADKLDHATQITHYNAQLDALERRRKEQESLVNRHKEEIDDASEEERTLLLQIAEGKKSHDKLSQLKIDLVSESEKKSARLTEISARWEKTAVELEEKRAELAELRSRRQSLTEVQKSYEGFAKGVKEVINWAEEEGGKYVLVGDIIEPEARYEAAVGAVLGDRLQYLVAASRKEGIEALNYLKEHSKGRASFIPAAPRSGGVPQFTPQDSAVLAELRSAVKVKEGFEAVADFLLGGVWAVKSLSDAERIIEQNPEAALTLVTPEGEVFEASGVLRGGSEEDLEAGFLARNRVIRELGELINKIEGEIEIVRKRYEADKTFLQDLKNGLDNLKQSSHQEEIKLVSLSKDIRQLEVNLNLVRERRETLRRDMARAKTQISEFISEVEQVNLRLSELKRRSRNSEEEELSIREKQTELIEKLNKQNAEHNRLEVQISTVEERKRSASSLINSIEEQLENADNRLRELAKKARHIEEQTARIAEETATIKERRAELLQSASEFKERLDAQKAVFDKRYNELSEREGALKRKQKAIADIREQLTSFALKEQEKSLKQNYTLEEYEQRYQVNLNKLEVPEGEFGEEELNRIEWLRQKIQELGAVNPAAIEEFEDLSKRYEFLVEQRDDLNRSVEKLKKAILKINKTSRERYLTAFAQINERFSTLFERLFNGGRAGLRMSEDTPDPLEAGVEIIAQPPGEKLKHLELLSGGQKALTAVSFIFAIFLYKPSPFCILDEIDAPLDDANIGRVNRLIKELSKESQFIIITHNKQTMEIAKNLYGVTNEEPGVSKLVSVRLSEVKPEDAQAAETQEAEVVVGAAQTAGEFRN